MIKTKISTTFYNFMAFVVELNEAHFHVIHGQSCAGAANLANCSLSLAIRVHTTFHRILA